MYCVANYSKMAESENPLYYHAVFLHNHVSDRAAYYVMYIYIFKSVISKFKGYFNENVLNAVASKYVHTATSFCKS